MSLISFKTGQGSIILRVKILDSSVTTGAGKTGLTNASTGLIISTIADNEATATVYTVAASHVQTIATLGTYAAPSASNCRFQLVDNTNHPGVYEIQIADARYAVSSAKSLLVSISGATNAADCDVVIPLTNLDPYDAVRAGLTAFPNVASGSAGALLVDGTGTAAISNSSGKVLLQATQTGVTIPTVTTVTNQLTAAAVATGIWQDTTAGDFTVASSIGKSLYTGNVAPGGTNGLLIAGSNAATTFATLTSTGAFSINGISMVSQTGDSYARIGAAGASLTAVGLAAPDTAVIATGTATAGASTTITLQTALGADSLVVGSKIKITSGTGAKQTRTITAYVDSTKVVTTDRAWVTNPDNTSVYAILYDESPKLDSSLKIAGVLLVDTLTTYTGNTVQTGDSYVRLGAPAGASIAADLAEIEAETDTIPAAGPSAAAIATAVWQDATAGDFTTSGSIGKSLFTSGVVPGAAGGLLIAGSNAATTFVTFTSTGALSINGVSMVSQTGDSFARIGAPAGASIAADLAEIEAETDTIAAAPTAAAVATAVWTDLLASSDFSTAASVGKLLKDDVDAAVSSRMATYTQPVGFLAAAFPATVGDATSANQTTILNRIGAWTGTGINTILGAFKSLLSKTASAPSDIGGTFDPTDDSTEAIRDRGDAAWITGTGTSTLDGAGVRAAVGMASANLDTQLAGIDSDVLTRFATSAAPPNFSSLGISAAGKITEVVLVDTLTTYTSNTPQTGDSYARIGAAGASLTALGDTRIAHLNADVTSRAAPGAQMDLVNAPNATALAAVATASWQLIDGIETGITPRIALSRVLSAECGELSGADTTTITILSTTGSRSAIIATVDSFGNRSGFAFDDGP